MKINRIVAVVTLGCILTSGAPIILPATVQAQTVGWCEADPGVVSRIALDRFDQNVPGASRFGDWTWHRGGRNTSQQCWDSTLNALDTCDIPGSCPAAGTQPTALHACLADPRVFKVHSRIDGLFWNPDGFEAYQQHGGQLLGQPLVTKFCCPAFGLNCSF